MAIINATEARGLMSKSKAYKDNVLAAIEKQIKEAAQKGIGLINCTIAADVQDEICDILVINDYRLSRAGSVVEIKWSNS